ncbi:hypothetical protein K438DRAFT_1982054 [Mycena galopus ATCC 62051]|nr:hypothetical protein K438DRAFT_1982054 [Mycena galopus ATCC 62051]
MALSEPREEEAVDANSSSQLETKCASSFSGAVIKPFALDALLPDWQICHLDPAPAHEQRNHFASLSQGHRRRNGRSIPGFAVSSPKQRTRKTRKGGRCTATLDSRAQSARASSRAWGSAQATLLAEGAHGGLSKQPVTMYDLRNGIEAQTWGIGLKEERRHAFGTPLPWLAALRAHLRRRMADSVVSIGLDYKNRRIASFSAPKTTHTSAPSSLATYASPTARALTEGGLQSLPRVNCPYRALVGPKTPSTPSLTFSNALSTLPAPPVSHIQCPAFGPPLNTDLMSNVALTGANHNEGDFALG